ncbi:N-acetyltransferase esco2 [Dissophora globulifera]|nr:N-acetyltransferase esco2 [Dissophora globulifera]
MNTPTYSASSSNTGSDLPPGASPPSTPHREYKFHRTIKRTYGRAKSPSDHSSSSPSSSTADPWYSLSRSSSNSTILSSQSGSTSTSPVQQQRRSRLSGSFAHLASPPTKEATTISEEPWSTPSKGTRTLTEKLERARLELESDSDSDDYGGKSRRGETLTTKSRSRSRSRHGAEDDDCNIFDVSTTTTTTTAAAAGPSGTTTPQSTPSKRKREFVVEVRIPVWTGPQSRRTTFIPDPADGSKDSDDDKAESSGQISPRRSASPSPPPSPSLRSSRNKRTRHIPSPASPFSLSPPARSKTPNTSVTSIDNNSSLDMSYRGGAGVRVGNQQVPLQQSTLSSFFATKAGKGTGILKAKTNSSAASNDSTPSGDKSASASMFKGESTESPKKLEQLFLAFSKDRNKTSVSSGPSATSSSPNRRQRPAAKTRLQREDERLKRFHCPQCGMPYVKGQPEDEQIHDRYHRAVLGGIDFPGYKNEVVVAQFNDVEAEHQRNTATSGGGHISSSRIVMVSMTDSGKPAVAAGSGAGGSGSSFEKRKVKEVLQLVNKELGSVDFDAEQLDSCKVFLYISGKKKVIGCVIAERIRQGFQILSSSSEPTATASSASADGSAPVTTTAIQDSAGSSAIFCSTDPQPAICGINRIWVSAHYRRQRIASRLLDAVRDRFIYACRLERHDLAFSQPTGDGKALARQYLGTDQFLVYVE